MFSASKDDQKGFVLMKVLCLNTQERRAEPPVLPCGFAPACGSLVLMLSLESSDRQVAGLGLAGVKRRYRRC